MNCSEVSVGNSDDGLEDPDGEKESVLTEVSVVVKIHWPVVEAVPCDVGVVTDSPESVRSRSVYTSVTKPGVVSLDGP